MNTRKQTHRSAPFLASLPASTAAGCCGRAHHGVVTSGRVATGVAAVEGPEGGHGRDGRPVLVVHTTTRRGREGQLVLVLHTAVAAVAHVQAAGEVGPETGAAGPVAALAGDLRRRHFFRSVVLAVGPSHPSHADTSHSVTGFLVDFGF